MLSLVARYNAEVIRWPLPAREAKLGSSVENDLVVPFPGVSRHHVTVTAEERGVVLSDLQSKNGIIVSGRRVPIARLQPGESVTIGRATLSIEDARTSDVVLALSTASAARTHDVHDTSAAFHATGDAAAALRLIRQIEGAGSKFSGRRRQIVLEQARSILGADTLALCAVHKSGEVAVACMAGLLPASDVLDRGGVIFARGEKRWRSATLSAGSSTLILTGRVHQFLVAVFGVDPPSWAEDLVGFVAEKMIGASTSVGEEVKESQPAVEHEMLVYPPGMVVGGSDSMKRLLHQIAATVSSRMDVLLLGETGTGKELFARMIHNSGPTKRGAFLAINCAAIPAELLEAELFGVHGRVATGVDPRPGLFAQANGGSILLDEIGELPDRLQAKLLRVLQEREILPIGATVPRRIDVRVISASNRNLAALVDDGRFRADLYYRLRGLQFHIPPLRDRKEDISALVLEFVTRAASEYGKVIEGVSRHALHLLIEHDWPGNVRELENEIRRAVLVCPTGGILQSDHLGTVRWTLERQRSATAPVAEESPQSSATEPPASSAEPLLLRDRIDAMEREEIERALAAAGGNQSRAARILGITRNGLALKLRRLGMKVIGRSKR